MVLYMCCSIKQPTISEKGPCTGAFFLFKQKALLKEVLFCYYAYVANKQGTTPLRGETFNEAKAFYIDKLEGHKQAIKVFKKINAVNELKAEQALYRSTYQQLKDLYHWRNHEGQQLLEKKISTRG